MRKKKAFRLLLIITASLFVFAAAKDFLAKAAVSAAAGRVTGSRVEIGRLSLGIIRQSVRIKGLQIYNPRGFSDSVLVDIPKASVDYDLFSLLKGKLHLRLLEIELKELNLERNQQGRLNVDSLAVAQKDKPSGPRKEKTSQKKPLQIDLCKLSVGRIVSKDYSAGAEPAVTVFDINFRKSYKNITSAEQLAVLILTEPMKEAGIRGASIYGSMLMTGVGIVPITIASAFAGKDSVRQDFNAEINKIYGVARGVLSQAGRITREDEQAKAMTANVQGATVSVKLRELSPRKTEVTVSARKYMLPKPEIASGLLYQISEKLR